MKRLALAAVIALGLSGLAAPAMASEPVPSDQYAFLEDAPVDPSPSHHTIKPPAQGKSDLWILAHGGFNDGSSTSNGSSSDYTPDPSMHTAAVLLKSGIIVAKVAKTKALKQPKQPKQKTAKAAKQPKQPKQPKQAATHPKTTKATTLKPPVMTVQQATTLAFAPPPKVRKVKLH